jgi:prolyl oligopeptidase
MIAMIPTVEESIHGVVVRDPYRWLEDRNLPETEAWIREQEARCEAYFAECPGIGILQRRVREYLDVEVVDQPSRVADLYFYRRRSKGEEQSSIYVRDASTAEERLLIAPSGEGPFTSVGIHRISENGKLLAFEVRRGGEDRKEIHVLDAGNGWILPDHVALGYARGFAFTAEGDGYLYAQEVDNSSSEGTIRLHRFGERGEDEIVFRVPRSAGSRLVLTANALYLGAIWFRPQGAEMVADFSIALQNDPRNWTQIFAHMRLPYNPILCHDKILALVETESKSSKLIELSTGGEELRTLVPERHSPIRQFAITRNRIYISYLERGIPSIHACDFHGQQFGQVDLPANGSIQILPVRTQQGERFFYTFESFDTPPVIYEFDPRTNTSKLWHQRGPIRRNPRSQVREVSIASKDGAAIPLTLVTHTSNMNGRHTPVIMTSYGGFGVSTTPQFSVLVSIMMELGVIFALPHIRGGGEFGKAWHDAGRARNRQAAIGDFIAAAEWLHRQGVTTSSKLGIFGGSNSGLLVGAAMTQRPDLFGAVLCIAPLLDMVRYEHFDQAVKWRSEYGSIEDPEDFHALYSYSPYHRVEDDIDYPPAMFISGDKDDRCNPAHVRKMVARLQDRNAQLSPIIVDYCDQRGHSPALPLTVRIEALVRRIAFLCRELHIPMSG